MEAGKTSWMACQRAISPSSSEWWGALVFIQPWSDHTFSLQLGRCSQRTDFEALRRANIIITCAALHILLVFKNFRVNYQIVPLLSADSFYQFTASGVILNMSIISDIVFSLLALVPCFLYLSYILHLVKIPSFMLNK